MMDLRQSLPKEEIRESKDWLDSFAAQCWIVEEGVLKPFSIQGLLYTLNRLKVGDFWSTLKAIPHHMQKLLNLETL